MAATYLALLSSDNVLRLVSRNGHGIEEKAAIALAHDHELHDLMDLVDTLIGMTQPAPAPVEEVAAIEAPKVVEKKPAPAKKKVEKKRAARTPRMWLNSAWLIRFIEVHDHLSSGELAELIATRLGRSDVREVNRVVHSRLSNLVRQKKLSRFNGCYEATSYGLKWATENDPPSQTPSVPEGQELLAE